MTFKATVIYQTLDGKILTKEIERVKKAEVEEIDEVDFDAYFGTKD